MLEHFQDGGFGMYPTGIFGLMLLAAAVQYARIPERRFVPLLVALGILTFAAGALGFVSGAMTTAKFVQSATPLPDSQRMLVSLYGVGESLNCIAFALTFWVMGAMAVCVGAFRVARAPAAPATA